jgi:hypothetical protein
MSERSLLGLGEGYLALVLCLCAVQASAQDRDNRENHPSLGDKNAPFATTLPDAPSANQDPGEGVQTKRILGIIPNFRAVSVDTHLPPQTPKEKFVGFAKDSFDYSSFIWIGALAGVSQLNNSTPEFGQGAAGFGRYYWHSLADQANENLWVEFLLPVAARQDPRYYTLGRELRMDITDHSSGRDTRSAAFLSRARIPAGIPLMSARSEEPEQPPPYPIFTIPVPSEPGLRPISDGY